MSNSSSPSIPLYRQLELKLRAEIESGRFGAEGRLPDERQLAAELGVSRTTVRQALRALEESKIVRRIQGSGTYANPSGLRSNDRLADKICLLTIGEAARYHQFVLAVMVESQASARRAGRGLYVENCSNAAEARELMLQIQADPAIEGGILAGMLRSAEAAELAKQAQIPWVMVGEFSDSTTRQAAVIDQVVGDDFHRAKLASQYLVAQGCRRPALFLLDETKPWSRDVASAYRMVMDDGGIAAVDQQICDVWGHDPSNPRTAVADRYHTQQAIRRVVDYWEVSGRWPDGIITGGDAFDALDHCMRTSESVRQRLGSTIIAACETQESQHARQRFPDFAHIAWFLTSIQEMTDMAVARLVEGSWRTRGAVRDYARAVQFIEPDMPAGAPEDQQFDGQKTFERSATMVRR